MTPLRTVCCVTVCCVAVMLLAAQRGVASQATPPVEVLAPARPGLASVPLPGLDGLEPAVAQHLREARQAFDVAVATRGAAANVLAAAYGALGQVLHAYEFFDAAVPAYDNAARLAPDDGRWAHLLGTVHQQTGRLAEAADRFAAARRLQPDDHVATLRLGEVYLELDRPSDARRMFEAVAKSFPAAAQSGLGEVALREGRFEEALERFAAVLERAPEATALYYSMAMASRGLGRLDEARNQLRQRGAGRVIAVDPIEDDVRALVRGERLLVIRGRRAYEAGRFQDAAEAFREAIEAAPDSVAARVNLGLALARLNDSTGASGQFHAALALDPGNVEAHTGLGMFLVARGQDAEAVEHFRAALARAPAEATAGRELATALLRLGRDEEAIQALEASLAARADDEDVRVGLAILLADRRRFGEAIGVLEDGHRRFPDRTATATTLARLLASSPDVTFRDGPRALEIALAVHAVEPDPAHGETVALALAELGRCEEARAWSVRAALQAEREGDTTEAARLRAEQSKYAGVSCQP